LSLALQPWAEISERLRRFKSEPVRCREEIWRAQSGSHILCPINSNPNPCWSNLASLDAQPTSLLDRAVTVFHWTATLGGCPDGGFGEFANPDCDRVHVSSGFFLSEEFRGRGYFAHKFYEVGLDRRPTYGEFMPDMVQVGGPQSPASEALSKATYTDAFVQRQEFKNRYDALANGAYVDALEFNGEVTLTNKAALVDALNTNQKTRAQVLREVVELQSVTDKFFIRAFVAMQYFGYLRRDPDTIGYDNWVAALTADPSNFRHMIFGFIFSDEYRHRFGP
jgi:hypothetical protein